MRLKWVLWVFLLVAFLYDQRYAAQKFETGFFLIGLLIRTGGLLTIGLLHQEWLWPAFAERGRHIRYAGLLAVLLVGYTLLQNTWDVWAYGYVIGDFELRNYWAGFLPALFNAFWFLAIALAFHKMLEWFGQRQQIARLEKELGDLEQRAVVFPDSVRQVDEIFLKSGNARIKVNLNDITHVQGLKDYAIVFVGNEKVIVKGSLKSVEARLADRLVRVHKSYLVARDHLRKIQSGKIIIGAHQIPVGRSYRESLPV